MSIDIEDVKPGDTVTLEHENGSKLVAVPVAAVFDPPHDRPVVRIDDNWPWRTLSWYEDNGWKITDHKPKVELPTEPGWYQAENFPISRGYWPYRLTDIGKWEGMVSTYEDASDSELADAGRMTRLVPENENRAKIAAEVIDWIATRTQYIPQVPDTLIDEFRKHFGVS
jgi:hypothetical protein